MRSVSIPLYIAYAVLGIVFAVLLALDCLPRIHSRSLHPVPGAAVLMVHGVVTAILLVYAVWFWCRGNLNKRIAWAVFIFWLHSWIWYTFTYLRSVGKEVLIINCAAWLVMWLSIPLYARGRITERLFLSLYFVKGLCTALAFEGLIGAFWAHLGNTPVSTLMVFFIFPLCLLEFITLGIIVYRDEKKERQQRAENSGKRQITLTGYVKNTKVRIGLILLSAGLLSFFALLLGIESLALTCIAVALCFVGVLVLAVGTVEVI